MRLLVCLFFFDCTSTFAHYYISRSVGSGFFSSIVSWLWISTICACDVPQTWIWKGRHDTGMSCDRVRMSSVSGLYKHRSLSNKHLNRPFLLWHYGKRIRMSSKYAQKSAVHRDSTIDARTDKPKAKLCREVSTPLDLEQARSHTDASSNL